MLRLAREFILLEYICFVANDTFMNIIAATNQLEFNVPVG